MTRTIGYLSGAPRVSTRPRSDVGGARSHVLGIIGAFRQLGYEVRPFVVGDRAPERVATNGHRVITRHAASALVADVGRLGLRVVNARAAWRELGREVDWVYERFAAFQALGRRFQRGGVPWVLETQGPYYEEARLDRRSLVLASIARRLELAAYRDCDVLVCVSHELKRRLVHAAAIPADKVLVVPNGVDPDRFDPARETPTRLFDGLTIVYAGSLTPWQGLDLLLRAMNELGRAGMPLNLVVIGDGVMRSAWEELAGTLGLQDRTRFLGRLPAHEVPGLVLGGDLGFAGHSPRRGQAVYHSPLKLYEYLAMEKPVVTSASEDALAVVRDGIDGFVYEPGNVAQIVGALRGAWAARARLAAMGRAGRQEILSAHTWAHRAALIRDGVAPLLGASGAGHAA